MIPGGVNELLLRSAAAGGATAGRSVRFNSADSAYLSRTPASAGNATKWTLSFWLKISQPDFVIFAAGPSNTDYFRTNINASGYFTAERVETTTKMSLRTVAQFRDYSAWYHFMLVVDSGNATEADRLKMYVNGVAQTLTGNYAMPLNQDTEVNTVSGHTIGRDSFGSSNYMNGYLALMHLIDGQALTPSSFGETSATTGQWIAKTYSGSYGTNGFFLDFLDNSTAAALGYDAAGSNDWTVNNLSVTAGSGNDSLRDHPTSAGTSTGLGGEVSGNYCTLNPLDKGGGTITDGNLQTADGQNVLIRGTISVSSGKWYYECTPTVVSGAFVIGVATPQASLSYLGVDAYGWGYTGASGGLKYNNGGSAGYGSGIAANDVIGVAIDMDAKTLTFYKNNTSLGTAYSNLTGSVAPAFSGGAGSTCVFNFGQRAWAYACPSGFSPLVDTLLPTPTIAKPNTVMDVALYTGNGSSQTITLPGAFSPDLVWVKERSSTSSNEVFDTVRGVHKLIETDNAGAEGTYSTTLTSFNSDGFSVGSSTAINESSQTYVAWTWDAGSSNATNTSGEITSTVRANLSAGFSVFSYTGPGYSVSVGHGLGAVPKFAIFKNRTTGGTNWIIYHGSLGPEKYMTFTTAAATTSGAAFANNSPDSSTFVLGSLLFSSSANYVCYAWTPVAGLSSFGSYVGNGSSDGPFVYTGFRPAYVLIKGSSSVTSWNIVDKQRLGYNADNYRLFAESSSAENATGILDFTATGFKIRNTGGDYNDNAQTYIYCAWAEAPFPYARAR